MKKDSASSDITPRQSRSNVVPLKGEIDLHVSPTVTATLNDLIDKKPERLVVDLSEVSYIDSAGLAALIQTHAARLGVISRGDDNVVGDFRVAAGAFPAGARAKLMAGEGACLLDLFLQVDD